MPAFKFFNSWQYKDFKIFCENNNLDETKLLKKYMRYTVILEADLTDSKQLSLNRQIQLKKIDE